MSSKPKQWFAHHSVNLSDIHASLMKNCPGFTMSEDELRKFLNEIEVRMIDASWAPYIEAVAQVISSEYKKRFGEFSAVRHS